MDAVEKLEAQLLQMPQVDLPIIHRFAPGVYMREILMPAGTVVIGHEHTTSHFNVVITGEAFVVMGNERVAVSAGDVFVSEAGVRKALLIEEDTIWQTIHPIEAQDAHTWGEEEKEALIGELETKLIVKSQSWLDHQHMLDCMEAIEQMKTGGQP
jgi:quercetin dioxygenase-like cupin family protein